LYSEEFRHGHKLAELHGDEVDVDV